VIVDRYAVQNAVQRPRIPDAFSPVVGRLIERYPDMQRQKGVLVKHAALTSELSRLVDERGLMEMSELEQELACTESLTEAFNKVETLVEDPKVSWEDKLRLVLLYSLRYELEGEREIRFLERSLKDAPGVPDSAIGACALMRRYAGVSVRGCDIFNKQTVKTHAQHPQLERDKLGLITCCAASMSACMDVPTA
jgi:vacuolar protein sorting-associated protein 45